MCLFLNNFNIIFVIHNDEEIYYDRYIEWKNGANSWLSISNKIEKRILNSGISPDKIRRVQWKIQSEVRRKRSDLFHIGFAGRLTKQKRVDMIISVAEILRQRGLRFLLEVAGKGEEEEVLTREINERGLSSCVKYLGLIPHNEIKGFWVRQDVCLSCSDYEGHSISIYEAMACGVVPVVTDVSGVKDDVTDGVNGFVVPVGDIERIVSRIEILYGDLLLLEKMSECCFALVSKRNDEINETLLWKEVLRSSNQY